MTNENSFATLRRSILAALVFALFASISTSANAQVVFDDVNGNASSDGAAPTSVAFSLGSNIINGTVTSPGNVRNFYTFTIGAGQELRRTAKWKFPNQKNFLAYCCFPQFIFGRNQDVSDSQSIGSIFTFR